MHFINLHFHSSLHSIFPAKTSLTSTVKTTPSSLNTLELTTVQKINTTQMSKGSSRQEITRKSIMQQSSITYSTSSIPQTQHNSKVTVAQSSHNNTTPVVSTGHSSTKGNNILRTISNSTFGFTTTISTSPTRPFITSHSQKLTLSQNSNTHLARNITGGQSTIQGTQTKITPVQSLTDTSTNSLAFTVVTLKTVIQTSTKQPASFVKATSFKNNTNIFDTRTSASSKFVQRSKTSTDRTSNVTTNQVSSTANSAQSVKGTKTLEVWLKTSKKTVQTTKIRAAVTEAPTGTNQGKYLILFLL